jgi:hypothetical protein
MTDEALLRRALMYWQVPGVTAAEVCSRFGVGREALRRARRALGALRLADGDLVQMALLRSERPLHEAEIIEFIDWVEHVRWSEGELVAVLARLEAAGRVRRAAEGWALIAEWP